MKIDREMVEKIAALSNLEFEDREIEDFTEQFTRIVGFVEQLAEVDTSGVRGDDIHGREDNALFDDCVRDWLERDEALANAPEDDGEFFLVPKVIREE